MYKVRIRIGKKGKNKSRVINIYNLVGYIDTIIRLEDLFGRNIRSSIILGTLTSTTYLGRDDTI